MRLLRIPLILLATLAGTLLAFFAGGLAHSYVIAETRGAVPLERLAERGSELERSLARDLADTLEAGPYPRDWRWAARRERSADGDTIRFAVYREQDTRFYRRMVQPEPVIAGGGVYIVSERRWKAAGVGVR